MNAKTRIPSGLVAGSLALVLLSACQDREAPRTHEEIIRADLAEILELRGSACGEVKHYALDDRLDYRVECASGDTYRIHVSAEGHVHVNDSGQ